MTDLPLDFAQILARTDPTRPVLIAGPTASGKSALALALARHQGGLIVNADALQVWSCWNLLSARPPAADLAAAPHALYGHVTPGQRYSVGDWLSEVSALAAEGHRLIVVGGTGLYFNALTQGLAVIPPVPAEIRDQADRWLREGGLADMVAALDAQTAARLDLRNPARVQRAWEVLQTTGRGLASWQADTPPPLIPPDHATRLVLEADRDWLSDRIERRFDQMLAAGVLDEVRAVLPLWQPRAQWAHAIGAAELIGHLSGALTRDEARSQAITATRQYAKAQRAFFRKRLRDWPRQPVGPRPNT